MALFVRFFPLLFLTTLLSAHPIVKGSFKRETRGVWVASVYNLDWPSRRDLSEGESLQEIKGVLDVLEKLHFNTIYLQVKPAWGVLYPSDQEPLSSFLISEGLELTYDPLAIWVEEAHKRGLFIHAWINPFRILENYNAYPESEPWVKKLPRANLSWLDPSYPEVREQVLSTLKEIMERYAFDGVHLDDYFYPYADSLLGQEFPDKEEYEHYQRTGGTKSRGEWRRENINSFIKALSQWMRIHYPSKLLGVSPFGIWKVSQAYNIKGLESYHDLFANSLLWINEGWIDYLAPQLYWSLDRPEQNFKHLLSWWRDHVREEAVLLAGIQVKPIGSLRENPEEELLTLHKMIQEKKEAQGLILFRLKTLLENEMAQAVLEEIFKEPALPAHVPHKPRPVKPIVLVKGGTLLPLNMQKEFKLWIRYQKGSSSWEELIPYTSQVKLPSFKKGESVEIRYLNESASASLPLFIKF
jgi:uncharacterized lipoprotein YddW (UPF0748 family)